jgi:hypothetical protein
VEISQRTVELTYVAVVGGPNRAALRDEVGHDTFDTILTEGPDGLDTILKQLDERRIPFDKQEVTDAMRNGGVEPSDELTTLGIETPQQWDARVSSEKKMEAALGPHFTKLARTLNFRVTPLCLKTLQNFAELAQKKGVADQATLIGVAGALYIVTHGGEQRLGDMTTDVLTGELSNHRSEIGKVAKFLKTRFPAVQKTAEDHQGEISKIVEEWDMKQDADLTASAVEVAPYVQV